MLHSVLPRSRRSLVGAVASLLLPVSVARAAPLSSAIAPLADTLRPGESATLQLPCVRLELAACRGPEPQSACGDDVRRWRWREALPIPGADHGVARVRGERRRAEAPWLVARIPERAGLTEGLGVAVRIDPTCTESEQVVAHRRASELIEALVGGPRAYSGGSGRVGVPALGGAVAIPPMWDPEAWDPEGEGGCEPDSFTVVPLPDGGLYVHARAVYCGPSGCRVLEPVVDATALSWIEPPSCMGTDLPGRLAVRALGGDRYVVQNSIEGIAASALVRWTPHEGQQVLIEELTAIAIPRADGIVLVEACGEGCTRAVRWREGAPPQPMSSWTDP